MEDGRRRPDPRVSQSGEVDSPLDLLFINCITWSSKHGRSRQCLHSLTLMWTAPKTIRYPTCHLPLQQVRRSPVHPALDVSPSPAASVRIRLELIPPCRSIKELKTQLLLALKPLTPTLPAPLPKSVHDIRIWEDGEPIEGSQETPGLRCIDDGGSEIAGKSILSLGWTRWTKVYVA